LLENCGFSVKKLGCSFLKYGGRHQTAKNSITLGRVGFQILYIGRFTGHSVVISLVGRVASQGFKHCSVSLDRFGAGAADKEAWSGRDPIDLKRSSGGTPTSPWPSPPPPGGEGTLHRPQGAGAGLWYFAWPSAG
jgi:hypothetical protein